MIADVNTSLLCKKGKQLKGIPFRDLSIDELVEVYVYYLLTYGQKDFRTSYPLDELRGREKQLSGMEELEMQKCQLQEQVYELEDELEQKICDLECELEEKICDLECELKELKGA